MSETVKSFIGRVAVVEQEGSAVRVLLNEGETMYAARDLLAACGCAYPTKWCQREAKSESDVKLVKLPFPVNGKTGGASRRSVPMYFVTERCGRMILDIFGCSKETRAWIEGKVFACKLGKPDEQTPTELPAPTQVAVPEKPTPPPTNREEVWEWFDERYSRGVAKLLLVGEPKDREVAQALFLTSLCCECDSEYCVFNPDGICKAPFVTGRAPGLNDDGCTDYCYKEAE